MDIYDQAFYDYSKSNPDTSAPAPNLDFNTLVIQPLTEIGQQCLLFIPDLIKAVYVFGFTWLIAKILQMLIFQLLKAFKFDNFAQNIGLNDTLNSDNSKAINPSQWVATVIFWFIILIGVGMAFDRLRLRMASRWLDDMVSLLLAIFTALTILLIGILVSELAAKFIKTLSQKFQVQQGKAYSIFIRILVLFFTLMLTLTQFHIPGQFILIGTGIIFITLCVTFAMAFGIGGSVWAAKVLDKLY